MQGNCVNCSIADDGGHCASNAGAATTMQGEDASGCAT